MSHRFPFHFVIALFFLLLLSSTAIASRTISGTVNLPAFPTGGAPAYQLLSVRVMGTDISSPVDASFQYALAGVPESLVALILETSGGDHFTQESRVITVDASTEAVTGADFNPVVHWTEINYPSVWDQPGYTGDWTGWETQWLSESVGFMLFKTNTDPWRVELYRTLNGGTNWSLIGSWSYPGDTAWGEGAWMASQNLVFHFSSADKGVVLADMSCSPCGTCGIGFYWTNDGGANWSATTLPAPGSSYYRWIERFATVSENHIIAAGGTGCGVQGYSSGFYNVIWESTDAGATWQMAWTSSENDSHPVTGLGANAQGDAICLFTPYSEAGYNKWVLRDGGTGTWGLREDTVLRANSGYGPVDIPMLGDTIWFFDEGTNGLPKGLHRSPDGGQNWELVAADLYVNYHGWADAQRGFFVSGGPSVTYDGGTTWLTQAGGEHLCCHGNDLWVFGARSAIWNEVDQVLSYADPDFANYEVVSGAFLPDVPAGASRTEVPAGSFTLANQGSVQVDISGLSLIAAGTGDDAKDISLVKLWLDQDGNGLADPGDVLLDEAVFSSDDGTASFDFALALIPYVPVHLAVTYNMASELPDGATYFCRLAPSQISGTALGIPVSAIAPAGHILDGPELTAGQTIFLDDFESGLGNWTADVFDAPWAIDGGHSFSPSQAVRTAVNNRDGNNDGAYNHLTLNQPLNLSDFARYYLCFTTRYYFDPRIHGEVYASSDGGGQWTRVKHYQSGSSSSISSGGVFVLGVVDLSDFAGQSEVLLRFTVDWTSGWYYVHDWILDDIEVVKVPFEESKGLDDGFESGGLLANPWVTGGNAEWFVDQSRAATGSFSARSGDIGDNGESWLQILVRSRTGDLSFDHWISTETNYDKLFFYVDGELQQTWSGNPGQWQTFSMPISSGTHLLTWRYAKDYVQSLFEDTVWIDNVLVPGNESLCPGILMLLN